MTYVVYLGLCLLRIFVFALSITCKYEFEDQGAQPSYTNETSHDEPDHDATVVATAVICIPSQDDCSCGRRCSSYNCAHSYK